MRWVEGADGEARRGEARRGDATGERAGRAGLTTRRARERTID